MYKQEDLKSLHGEGLILRLGKEANEDHPGFQEAGVQAIL